MFQIKVGLVELAYFVHINGRLIKNVLYKLIHMDLDYILCDLPRKEHK